MPLVYRTPLSTNALPLVDTAIMPTPKNTGTTTPTYFATFRLPAKTSNDLHAPCHLYTTLSCSTNLSPTTRVPRRGKHTRKVVRSVATPTLHNTRYEAPCTDDAIAGTGSIQVHLDQNLLTRCPALLAIDDVRLREWPALPRRARRVLVNYDSSTVAKHGRSKR